VLRRRHNPPPRWTGSWSCQRASPHRRSYTGTAGRDRMERIFCWPIGELVSIL